MKTPSGFIFCISLLLIFTACSSKPKEAAAEQVQTKLSEEQTQVKVVKLSKTAFALEILANGTVAAGSKTDLYFQSSEAVVRIFVKNGDHVSKGQKIAQLDLFKLNNALQQASDNLEKANWNCKMC